MLADGDLSEQDVLFEYFLREVPFLTARTTALFPNETGSLGFWQTETATKFGALTQVDYGLCGQGFSRTTEPPWLGANPYVLWDRYGDGPMSELSLMILDRYLYDGDDAALSARLPWAFGAVDFFAMIYKNRTAAGQIVVWPTQTLETYWCPWPVGAECVTNDAPTVSTVTRLLQRLLMLPARFSTPAQRAGWSALLAAMPPLPFNATTGLFTPAEQFVAAKSHNSESGELYAVHPARLFSVGRNLTVPGGVEGWAAMVKSFYADPDGSPDDDGWHQGVMQAPLLGERVRAGQLFAGRLGGHPVDGYRFPFFSGEDGMNALPSIEWFSNLASGIQFALVQPGDDDGAGEAVLLPGWPCGWNVSFALRGPKNAMVRAVFAGGAVQALDVEPPERAASFIVAPGCG